MNRNRIKVTIEYVGAFHTAEGQDYRVLKIVGAPTIEVETDHNKYNVTRVGDIITEKQATELADRVEVTTIRKTP